VDPATSPVLRVEGDDHLLAFGAAMSRGKEEVGEMRVPEQ
jgi:hypothetical protein